MSNKRRLNHDPVLTLPLADLIPANVNNQIYRPVLADDPDVLALANDIAQHGLLEPLVVTANRVIVSGHRRFAAMQSLGLSHAKCRVLFINSSDARFTQMLVAFNRQRIKSNPELLREEVVLANPDEEYKALIAHRRKSARIKVDALDIGGRRHRCKISDAKGPFLAAAKKIVNNLREYWPLSVRQIHYQLLNQPPLIHAKKKDSTYRNNETSYKALISLLARARLEGAIPFEAIDDPTRPVTSWKVHRSPAAFIRAELADFLKNFWRDLLQSQPNHVELIGEKNTVQSVLRQVAAKYTMALTVGRGYTSIPPLRAMANRFHASGKERLVVLVVSDFDPEGEDIALALAKTLRDDLGIKEVHPIKVALNREQIDQFRLPPLSKAKSTSSRAKGFTEKHGQDVWELEALSPKQLADIVAGAIDAVIDRAAFNAELDAEKNDAAFLATVRRRAAEALAGIADESGDE